jgi:RNA polymerase sporulation-specific sigma factor
MNLYRDTDISDLLIRCRQHDDDAFDELVRRYTPMMRKVISGFAPHSIDYSELFSEACVALHVAVGRFDMEQSEVTFGLYARICVRNRIVDLLRTMDNDVSVADYDVEMMTEGESVESKIADREEFELILGSAKRLLSDYEYSVLLLHIQGYKTAAIAKALGRTAKSVDNAKSRLFRRLRSEICSISDN